MKISREQFAQWLSEAIDSLPEEFSDKINNIAFFVEDEPTEDQFGKTGKVRNENLLGLYEGYVQSSRKNIGPVLPDRITLFRGPIVRICSDEAGVKNQIVRTLRHEIAHHFGSGEKGAAKAAGRGGRNQVFFK